ncbi:MAG: thioredoxin fold domain-containing protein [Daejeonella sp.]|uniref:thioredoxin family protein n=1 Tax=Daejeonella sp. TaxID=2805397 RepID=UPI00273575C4|nr:thioredoxin fold domain-containing protein [Daejeonella sp.]MDP3467236.1 thioredoxin fold domain-containing protein [Daejeonella sp.]
MLRILIVFIFVLMQVSDLQAQNRIVKFEEIKILQNKTPKPIVVLIMTSWCKYCHAMKNTMRKDSKVSALLNDKFYTVFLYAEDKNDIFFAGRIFKHKAGLHELARELGTIKGQISYPTITVLNSKNEIIYQHDGFLNPRAMLYLLQKVAKN